MRSLSAVTKLLLALMISPRIAAMLGLAARYDIVSCFIPVSLLENRESIVIGDVFPNRNGN